MLFDLKKPVVPILNIVMLMIKLEFIAENTCKFVMDCKIYF